MSSQFGKSVQTNKLLLYLFLRDDVKSTTTADSIDGKISLVQSKDGLNSLAFGKINQGGIGELRSYVVVPFHYGGNGSGFRARQRQQFQKTAVDGLQELSNSAWRSAQKPSCLGDHRPAREQRPRHLAKSFYAGFMVFVVAGENGNQRTCIDENLHHLRFPKPSK